jgi:hypothetical protein
MSKCDEELLTSSGIYEQHRKPDAQLTTIMVKLMLEIKKLLVSNDRPPKFQCASDMQQDLKTVCRLVPNFCAEKKQKTNDNKNDARWCIEKFGNSIEHHQSDIGRIFIGSIQDVYKCKTCVDPQPVMGESRKEPYVVQGMHPLSSLTQLRIGTVHSERESTFKCFSCSRSLSYTHSVWSGEPPSEILALQLQIVPTSIDLQTGLIPLTYINQKKNIICTAFYAIRAVGIAVGDIENSDHQVAAVPIFDRVNSNTPVRWIVLDNLCEEKQPLTSECLPDGAVTTWALYRLPEPRPSIISESDLSATHISFTQVYTLYCILY